MRITSPVAAVAIAVAGVCACPPTGLAQEAAPPTLRVGALPLDLAIDGVLDERGWQAAEAADQFTQTDPQEGVPPSSRTVVRVLAGPTALVIGIICEESRPEGIVSFSVRRDANLSSEDHVRIVLGPSLDGRSGYVFGVNPSGARYDGLIEPGGESERAEWDGIWEAATSRTATGWSAEIRIPIRTLSFRRGLDQWDFNVQRRIQGLLETDRWASPARQYQVTQMSRAGRLTGLPDFTLGLGLSVRPSLTAGRGVSAPSTPATREIQPSLDMTQRLGPNVLALVTANTDFAETDVDTRRTNLTRFPLFFPEKRTFFLEGADLFSFGLGLGQDVLPYFSRRMGLVGGQEVPVIGGGKVAGRVGNTDFGALVVGTNDKTDVVANEVLMATGRIRQNILGESWIGAMATVGDPLGRAGSWLVGTDVTYATSRFRGDKNLLVGAWGLATGREGLGADASAYGVTMNYPNDLWDITANYKRIGRDFDPSIGFVPRPGVHLFNLRVDNRIRVATGPLQQLVHEFGPFLATDLSGKWESYRIFLAPVNWRFRSADRLEVNANPTGERLVVPFDIGGVSVPAGSYHWMRYRLEVGTAQERRFYTQVAWWFGGFYDGHLDQYVWTGTWNPTPLFTVELSGERDFGRLAGGRFTQTLLDTRVRVNLSPDLSVASYLQYDTDSKSIGTNTRIRWTLLPVADLFVVYNHNVRSILDRWQRESNQLLIKVQYALLL